MDERLTNDYACVLETRFFMDEEIHDVAEVITMVFQAG